MKSDSRQNDGNVWDMLDQLYVIVTRLDGRITGIVDVMSEKMDEAQDAKLRDSIRDSEVANTERFISDVENQSPETAIRLQAIFDAMKQREGLWTE